jgi:hypothetical protein
MKIRATCISIVVLASASGAWADDGERIAMVNVRLSTERVAARGCTPITKVSDDSVKDIRRKIVKVGGNLGVLAFGVEDLSTIYADVYRCDAPAASPAGTVPARVPPPPPGPPPPPPPR